MTSSAFAQQLMDAADGIDDLSRSDLQILLRRAALRVENKTQQVGTTILTRDIADVIDEWAAARGVSRDDAVNEALRDWSISMGLTDPGVLNDE
ncbi:CopG family transcriptional regulator [Nitratireductor sp. GCM10026969]|uniref:CopG family transcriptional regulator n=1 Tax=Nitratireductor sp. GCM10026969 TaxID=3252645 RepID=UPI00360DAADA